MTDFNPIASTIGGLLIGLSAAAMLALNGRIAGISGILGGLLEPGSAKDHRWRAFFVGGLVLGGIAMLLTMREGFGHSPVSLPGVVVAGLLVGFGTRLGGGCTSGHGVCGISRMSARSIVATLVFMATGAITVFVVHHLGA